ncbi:aminotransferase [Bacilli bacterium]|nr:aminotransferase [Bacilli bacterium]
MIYADSAATSLKPQCVIDAVIDYYSKYSTNSHSTDSDIAIKTNSMIDDSRKKVAKFINALPNEIAFTSGATESLNTIANGLIHLLKKDDEIIISYGEHSSNLLPWIRLKDIIGIKLVICGKNNSMICENDFVESITPKTKIIAFSDSSNLLGYSFSTEKLIKDAKKKNSKIIFINDCTNSIQHKKIDVKKSGVDFACFSMHKIFGPTGVGVTYGKHNLIEKIDPMKFGGGMVDEVDGNKFSYAKIPAKFEGGTPNIAGIIGSGAAIDFFNSIGYSQISKYEKKLKTYLINKLKDVKHINHISINKNNLMCAFNFKNIYPQDLASYLNKNNVIVRSGVSCVKLQHKLTCIPEGFVRASF